MRLLFTIALLFGGVSVWAQYYMDVSTKDGDRILIPITNVDSVRIIDESGLNQPNGTYNGYEYVDLGLSVMWASYNIGANSPEEPGKFFAWGEVTPKDEYTLENYKFFDGYSYSKYAKDSTSVYRDNKTILDKRDDAARYNMGGKWRMPTMNEFQELVDNCTFSYTTFNGVDVITAFSKINGKSIIFPRIDGKGYLCYFWTSSLFEYGDPGAIAFYGFGNSGGYLRYQGFTVRGVYSETEEVPTITATVQFDANGGNGEMQPIRIWSDDVSDSIIIPSNIFTREGYKFTGWNTAADGSGTSYKEKEVVSMGQDMTLYAQWKEKIYLETLDGKIVKFTESVGSEYEASYGALVTLLPQRDIENAGLSADDYIGINLTYNWYGLGVKVINCIYINTKDYSLFSPTQYVAYTDESFEIGGTPYGATYGPGRIMFGNFEGAFDTQTNTLTFSHSAVWLVDVGSLQMGTDNYKVEFEEIIE